MRLIGIGTILCAGTVAFTIVYPLVTTNRPGDSVVATNPDTVGSAEAAPATFKQPALQPVINTPTDIGQCDQLPDVKNTEQPWLFIKEGVPIQSDDKPIAGPTVPCFLALIGSNKRMVGYQFASIEAAWRAEYKLGDTKGGTQEVYTPFAWSPLRLTPEVKARKVEFFQQLTAQRLRGS